MAIVRNKGQTPQKGYHTKEQVERTSRPALARDEIYEAFAGTENENFKPAGDNPKPHSTNVKSRKTKKSKYRTPIR